MSITSTKINHSSDSVLSIQILSFHHAIKEEEREEKKRRGVGVKGREVVRNSDEYLKQK